MGCGGSKAQGNEGQGQGTTGEGAAHKNNVNSQPPAKNEQSSSKPAYKPSEEVHDEMHNEKHDAPAAETNHDSTKPEPTSAEGDNTDDQPAEDNAQPGEAAADESSPDAEDSSAPPAEDSPADAPDSQPTEW